MPSKKIRTLKMLSVLIIVAGIVFAAYHLLLNKDKEVLVDLPEIRERGTLRVVTDYNVINYYVSGDTVAGFTHDLLSLLAKDLGLKMDIRVENNLGKCIEGLENGTFDIIARNTPVNNALKDSIAFTHPIVRNKLVLVQRKPEKGSEKSSIRNHLDLANAIIYVPRSSPAKLRLENLALEIGDTIIVREDSLYDASQLIMKVAAGEIDFAVCDALLAKRLLANNPEVDIKTDIGFTHLEAWAVRNSSPILLDSLNVWIDKIQSNPEFRKIYKRYFDKR